MCYSCWAHWRRCYTQAYYFFPRIYFALVSAPVSNGPQTSAQPYVQPLLRPLQIQQMVQYWEKVRKKNVNRFLRLTTFSTLCWRMFLVVANGITEFKPRRTMAVLNGSWTRYRERRPGFAYWRYAQQGFKPSEPHLTGYKMLRRLTEHSHPED